MSRSLGQPIGQKRLTNVAVVRIKKQGFRFEVACYKNKVLSWRSGVEKDLDEVLQSRTVYSNVSKGILAKTKDLISAFGMCDQNAICLEILDKGELQVAGKERESQLSIQFRDIATIVMQKTVNTETQRPYTITMIEQLMHAIHFAVDPRNSSKKQSLVVIRELQKKFPIKRCPMRLRIIIPNENVTSFKEKLDEWDSQIESDSESGNQSFIICELDPGHFRDCDKLVRNLQGRLEILDVTHISGEGDTEINHFDEIDDFQPKPSKQMNESITQVSEKIKNNTIEDGEKQIKQNKCNTCDAIVGDAKQYREHFKSDWHKHNMKRKTRQLPPVSPEDCAADIDMVDTKGNLKDYNF